MTNLELTCPMCGDIAEWCPDSSGWTPDPAAPARCRICSSPSHRGETCPQAEEYEDWLLTLGLDRTLASVSG
jgi:hypothetical protein